MQVYECKKIEMKRDMDLIRELLLHIEENPIFDGTRWMQPHSSEDLGITDRSFKEVAYHLNLLVEEGLVRGTFGMEAPQISRLTSKGHDFLDDTRDPGIWKKTKERLKGLPSVGIAIIGEIAKAEIKKHLGLA
jgi:hypothetical protein